MTALITLTLALVAAPHRADVKSDLQAKYDKLSAAFAARDIKPFDDALAKNFVLHVGQKNTSREAVLADFKRQMANMSNVKWVRTVTLVSQAKMGYSATVKSIFDGDFDAGGTTKHFWNSAVALDTWTKNSQTGEWKLSASRLVSLDAKIDGQPAGHFPPKKGEKPQGGGH